MPSQDDTEEGLRGRLRGLFDALQSTLQSMDDGSGELAGPAAVLALLKDYLQPALDREMPDAAASGAATWHLAHLAADVIDSVEIPAGRGTPFHRVRKANEQLKTALAEARSSREGEAEELEEIEALVRQVVPGVVAPIEVTLLALHGETLSKLGDVQTVVGNVAPAVVSPLETVLTSLHGETLARVGDVQTTVGNVQTAVGNVAPAVLVPLAAQNGEIISKLNALDHEVDELEELVSKLPQNLAEVLLKNLPDIVRAVVVAIKTPVPATTTVSKPVHFNSLDELAGASASDYTDSAGHRIAFLQAAFDVIDANKPVPPLLIPPIVNVVMDVLNYRDPGLSGPDLFTIASLKQKLVPLLNAPASVGR